MSTERSLKLSMRCVMSFLAATAITMMHAFKVETLVFECGKLHRGWMEGIVIIGYITCMIPIAILAERFSAKWAMVGIFILNFISPFFRILCHPTNEFYAAVIISKFLEGATQGGYFPIIHTLIAKWSPPNERSFIASIIYSGAHLGQFISHYLMDHVLFLTDPAYKIFGCLGFLWILAWCILIEDAPEVQKKFISQEEKKYILESLGKNSSENNIKKNSRTQTPFPFKQVIKSKPFLAIFMVNISIEIAFSILRILPTANVLQASGYFANIDASGIPFLITWIFSIICGGLTTLLLEKNRLNITQIRKISSLFVCIIPLIMFLFLPYTSNGLSQFLLRTAGITSYGLIYSGFFINHIDLAPNFAGTLLSVTKSLSTFLTFLVSSLIILNKDSETWSIVGIIFGTLFSFCILFYWIFASGEKQSWNRDNDGYIYKNSDTHTLNLSSSKI